MALDLATACYTAGERQTHRGTRAGSWKSSDSLSGCPGCDEDLGQHLGIPFFAYFSWSKLVF